MVTSAVVTENSSLIQVELNGHLVKQTFCIRAHICTVLDPHTSPKLLYICINEWQFLFAIFHMHISYIFFNVLNRLYFVYSLLMTISDNVTRVHMINLYHIYYLWASFVRTCNHHYIYIYILSQETKYRILLKKTAFIILPII